jgi:hypothetical protein
VRPTDRRQAGRDGAVTALAPPWAPAVAAAALVAVLVVRVVRTSSHVRGLVPWLAGGYVLVIAVARLVEEVHSLTDLLGGAVTGLLVTLAATLGITAWSGRGSYGHL